VDDPLSIYLEDHLAGAAAGISLLESLRDHHPKEALGSFAAEILVEVEADRTTLQALAKRVGAKPGSLKEATALLAEKVSRLKLGRLAGGELGTFEALETLALGILGKKKLWEACAALAPEDPRLQGMDFPRLVARAEEQHRLVEQTRLEAARTALRGSVEKSA
jgi:hypothetical protein